MRPFLSLLLISLLPSFLLAQNARLSGLIRSSESQEGIPGARVIIEGGRQFSSSDAQGYFEINDLAQGSYTISIFAYGFRTQQLKQKIKPGANTLHVNLAPLQDTLQAISVEAANTGTLGGVGRLNSVEGFGIYEAKKTEVILLDEITANKSTNNPRQIFAKVPGLNIWESDCAGLQLDIAARGLGPSRTSNFNTRQNGYDMSADALGYPESYYTPPMQAVERIEIVRGAASLQYGTQFGGMLNFVLKDAPEDKPLEFRTELTYGSFGFLNSFNSVGGTLGKFSYYAFYQYKEGNCWRHNSGFDLHNGYMRLGYEISPRLRLTLDYTGMNYVSQQPGGLTDQEFRNGNPRESKRQRNWFRVDWNLFSLNLDYHISDRTQLNMRNFGLLSGRDALGNLERIDRIDLLGNRTLIEDDYRNFGNETRLLHRYNIKGQPQVLLLGFRYYRGFTAKRQGDANDGFGADFEFLNPDNLEVSDYDFPSRNYAFFAEHIFNLSEKFSITPGFRVEHIRTKSEGFYNQIVRNRAGEIIVSNQVPEETDVKRSFPLFGLGLSYKLDSDIEFYANFSENYRSVTFSSLRVENSNFQLDSTIRDEEGYNLDLGARGMYKGLLNFDVSLFYLRYNDRIGFINLENQPPLFLDQRSQTNVGDSEHYGLEAFAELDLWKWFISDVSDRSLSLFTNFSWIDARYLNNSSRAAEGDIDGNRVEYVPSIMLRSGLSFRYKNLQATYLISYLSEQYTDATNAGDVPVAGAVSGTVPSYHVMDFSMRYRWKFMEFEGGVNNLTDEIYFTRRAESYPGPGIIPAAGRSFYLTLKAVLN